jgi:hypothetical protein
MSLISKINLLLVNAVTLRREFKILITRVAIFILLYSCIIGYVAYITYLDNRISIYNSLFHSKGSTSAGLTYFLLGCLSSCFILLGSGFLYANCGITSLDAGIEIYNDLFYSISYDTESIKLIYPEPSIIMSSIVYTANTPKARILKENKGKSGIYL